MDLDELIDGLIQERKQLSIKHLEMISYKLKEILIEESNIQPIPAPVTICGNIHGQFSDLLDLFRINGEIPLNNYIFLGGYVSCGYDSVQVIELLLCLKLKYPGKITLIRGRHETREMSQIYGFSREIEKKYGSLDAWKIFMDLFDYFPIGALLEGEILCIPAGLSPEVDTLDQIRMIDRKQEIPKEGAFCDLAWSNPESEIEGWAANPLGAGYLFGEDIVKKFNHTNNLELIARGNNLAMSGYDYPYGKDNFVTIWSAPNYKARCGNLGATMSIDEDLNRKITCFKETPP